MWKCFVPTSPAEVGSYSSKRVYFIYIHRLKIADTRKAHKKEQKFARPKTEFSPGGQNERPRHR